MDRETEELKHDKIPVELGKIIQQGRNAKGLSQKELATVRDSYIAIATFTIYNFPFHFIICCAKIVFLLSENLRETTNCQRL